MATTPTLQSHDILLTDYASPAVTLGLIIEKDKNGIPIFHREPADSLSQQQFQSLSQAIFPPQYQGFITQKTWHGGFGKQQLTGTGGDNRYMKTAGVDCSVKGLSYPAPVPVAMTNSNPTQTGYNMGFENWTTISSVVYLDNWAYKDLASGYWLAKDTTNKQAGSASLRGTIGADSTQILRMPLGVTAVNGSIFTLTIYGRATTVDFQFNTTLYNPADETNLGPGQVNAVTAGTGWVQKTYTYTFTGTVTNPILSITMLTGNPNEYWLDTAVITWTGTAVTTLTVGSPVRQVEFNNNLYMVSNTGVWKLSGADWTWVGGSPPGITDAFISAGGAYLVLCRGSSFIFWLMQTNEGFIIPRGTGAGTQTQHGAAAAGKTYMSLDDTTVFSYSSDALLVAASVATYSAGQTGYKITGIVNHLETLYALKENGAFYIPTSGTVMTEVAQELRNLFNTNTGKNSISWRGNGAQTLYIPGGGGAAMLAYDATGVVNAGPDQFAENLSDFTGQIVATAADDQWLYVCLDNGAKIEILKGRYEKIDGVTDFRWHPIIEDTYATVGYMHVSSITAKRLYYGGGTALPKFIPLPTAYGAPLSDTALTFNTGVTAESSWYDLNVPRITKTYLNFTIDSTGLTANITIKVEYQLWESQGAWVELGGSGNGTFNTSPTQTKTYAINISGRKIRFRFTYTTNNTATAYGMYEYTCRLALAPKRLNIYTATVRVGSENLTKKGAPDTEMVYSKVAPQLHTWRDTQPLLITYPDGQFDASDGSHNGATEEVKFLEGYPKEIPVDLGDYGFARRDPESLFQLALVSIDRSIS